jgi:serine/threonine-protein kinase RIO1
MSSAEDEYKKDKKEGRLTQLSPQEQMKYVEETRKKMEDVGNLNRTDILNLLREALLGKDLNEYTADSDKTYQEFLKFYHNRKQGGRKKSKYGSKKSRFKKSRSKKSRSKKSRSKKSRSKSRK